MRKNMYINGEWRQARSYTELRSPYSGEIIAEIPMADEQEVEEAIEAAYQCRGKMKHLTPFDRSEILSNLVILLTKRKEEGARIIASEAAKPIKYARDEMSRTIETYKFAAEEAKRLTGEMVPLEAAAGGRGKTGYTIREPVGVIGAITPFNFPMNLVAHKVGPAIACGNTIVLKPASQTPLSAYFLAELLEEAGLPAGGLNVITGSGRLVGDKIVTSDKVHMITFTGSPEVGKSIQKKSGLKKITLELGSNAGVIIDKHTDIKAAAARCVFGAFYNQGQVCISLQRVYAHEDIYEELLKAVAGETEKLVIGDPQEEETDISSLISLTEAERSLAWIEEAASEGAEVISGGKTENAVLQPTVLTKTKETARVSCQEAFAPLVVINPVASVEEGIKAINASSYGLQAGIYTNDIQTAFDAVRLLEVGGVIINDIPTFRVDNMPYGGVKESGVGKEGIKYSMHEMTEEKLVVWNTK